VLALLPDFRAPLLATIKNGRPRISGGFVNAAYVAVIIKHLAPAPRAWLAALAAGRIRGLRR